MEVLIFPTLGAAVLVIALAGSAVAALVTRNKDTSKEIFAGILSFFVGGAIGSALLATPVVILVVMPLTKVLKLQTGELRKSKPSAKRHDMRLSSVFP